MAFIHQQEFKLMDGWPACSPDLSWIENLWSWVERKLREKAETLTEENFAQKLHETWNSIPTSLLQSLHGSIQSRLQECIDKKGSSIPTIRYPYMLQHTLLLSILTMLLFLAL